MTVSLFPERSPDLTKAYTAEEYLALEVASGSRSEFRDGEIVEMTGGTPAHNEIHAWQSFC